MRAHFLTFLLASCACLAPPLASAAAAADAEIPAVLISRQLAAEQHLRVGQVVRLARTAEGSNPRSFKIAGIFEPTPDPGKLGTVPRKVRMHLPDLLELTRPAGVPAGSESIAGINIQLTAPADAPQFARDVAGRMPGLVARPATRNEEAVGPFIVLRRFHLAIAMVTIIAATVFLLALSIMLVDERRSTVGILRLIGLPSQRILVQLFVEGALIAGVGALFGLILSIGSARIINRFFQWHYDTALIFVRITPGVAAICVAIAVPLGVCATVAASWALLRRSGLRLARR